MTARRVRIAHVRKWPIYEGRFRYYITLMDQVRPVTTTNDWEASICDQARLQNRTILLSTREGYRGSEEIASVSLIEDTQEARA